MPIWVVKLIKNFSYSATVTNGQQDVTLPESLVASRLRESERMYTYLKALEELIAKCDKHFIKKCHYLL